MRRSNAATRLLAIVLAMVLVGCTETEPTRYGIESFMVSPTRVAPGDTAALSWVATAIDETCQLQATTQSGVGAAEAVACTGTRTVVVDEAVNYQLSVLVSPDRYDYQRLTIDLETEDVVVTVLPGSFAVAAGERRIVSASVSGTPDADVTWSATGGRIEGTGSSVSYVAPDEPGGYEITATLREDATTVGRAAVTVEAAGVESFSASASRVAAGDTVQLAWSASGYGDACRLQSTRASGSSTEEPIPCVGSREVTIDETVSYRVSALISPSAGYDSQVVTISLETATVLVTVLPGSFTIGTGEERSVTASVSGTDDERVTWSATGGQVVGEGATVTYVAPDRAGTYEITASSVADPSVSDTANATVEQFEYAFDVSIDGAYDEPPSGGSISGLVATTLFERSDPMWMVVTVTNTGTKTATGLEIGTDLSQAPDVSGGFVERYRRTDGGGWSLSEDRPSEAGRIPEFVPGDVTRLVFASDGAFDAIGSNLLRVYTDGVSDGPLAASDVAEDATTIDVVVDASDLEAVVTRLVTVRSVYPYPGPSVADPYGFAALKRSSTEACGRDSYGAFGVTPDDGDHRWACLAWSAATASWDAQLETVVEVRTGSGTTLCSRRYAGTARTARLDLDTCAGGPSGTIYVRVGRDDGQRVAFGSEQAALVLPRIDLVAPVEGSISFVGGTYQFEWDIEGTLPAGASTQLRMYDVDSSIGGAAPLRGSDWDVQYALASGAESTYPSGVPENAGDHYRWFVRSSLTLDSVSAAHALSEKHRMCRMQALGDSSNCSYAFTGSD